MSQETVKKTECLQDMSEMEIKMQKTITNLERTLRRLFWGAMIAIVTLGCTGFGFYYNQQEKKINKIAVASIKADERLQKQLDAQDARMIAVERQQASMAAKLEANMKWLIDACARIEAKQARIEESLKKTP